MTGDTSAKQSRKCLRRRNSISAPKCRNVGSRPADPRGLITKTGPQRTGGLLCATRSLVGSSCETGLSVAPVTFPRGLLDDTPCIYMHPCAREPTNGVIVLGGKCTWVQLRGVAPGEKRG